MIKVENLCWNAGGKAIVNNVSFSVKRGEFLGLVGPNGCGKTSTMALLAGLNLPHRGNVYLKGQPLKSYNRRQIACHIGFVEQHADTSDNITVRQAVELGRTPHLSAFSPFAQPDEAVVNNALSKVNMTALADRAWNTLSGGEKQRIHFARALAQEPSIMLLDEPTNHLDIQHQLHLLDLVRQQNLTVVAALHDLNHAAQFCDRIMMMKQGQLVAIGSPKDVLTTQRIADVFHVCAQVNEDEDGGLHIRFRPHKLDTH
ncbi:ABC transporter ATP-binding protein [Bartonella sp. DGB2]|uniref:ABC transporter ATP-binding protein n=1 Tax=Bartonella sp. DGB2 TaxID=3388426 RepID=UPI00398FE3CB